MSDTKQELMPAPAAAEGALAITGGPVTAAQLVARRNMILEAMRTVMKKGVHYGDIPGCDKPSLFQAGASVLCNLFGLRKEVQQEREEVAGRIRVSSTCKLFSIGSGLEVGEGIGVGSTSETKWLWKKCWPEEWNAMNALRPERCRKVMKKGDRGLYEVLQVMQEPDDMLNTISQMSAKRAYVSATRDTTGCQDLFTMDMEDTVDEEAPDAAGQENVAPAAPKAGTSKAPAADRAARPAAEGEQVWTGTIATVKVTQFTNATTKQKQDRWYVTGADKIQFETILKNLADVATQLKDEGTPARIVYRSNQYGQQIADIRAAGGQ